MKNDSMTTAQARLLGFEIVRGNYVGTPDDRADRWYINQIPGPVDHRGSGFLTRKSALQELEYILANGRLPQQ